MQDHGAVLMTTELVLWSRDWLSFSSPNSSFGQGRLYLNSIAGRRTLDGHRAESLSMHVALLPVDVLFDSARLVGFIEDIDIAVFFLIGVQLGRTQLTYSTLTPHAYKHVRVCTHAKKRFGTPNAHTCVYPKFSRKFLKKMRTPEFKP